MVSLVEALFQPRLRQARVSLRQGEDHWSTTFSVAVRMRIRVHAVFDLLIWSLTSLFGATCSMPGHDAATEKLSQY